MRFIEQDKLRHLLQYTEDGKFVWKNPQTNRVKIGDVAGSVKRNGYRHVQIDNTCHLEHRLVWIYFYGCLPDNDIDHINGIRDDNRVENLRAATRTENMRNSKRRKDNITGVVGVYRDHKRDKWYSTIRLSGKNKFLGYFDCKLAATIVRKCAEKEYGYHKNHGRT